MKTERDPQAAFIFEKNKIDQILERIQNKSDDHFGKSPENIGWGDVRAYLTPRCGFVAAEKAVAQRLCDFENGGVAVSTAQ